jgi:acyl transferase domain-containing protein
MLSAMPVSNNARLQPTLSSPDEDVVISGLAGYFPECENVYQLRDNLFNKVDMVTVDNRRWKFGQ